MNRATIPSGSAAAPKGRAFLLLAGLVLGALHPLLQPAAAAGQATYGGAALFGSAPPAGPLPNADWLAAVQEDIRQREYAITWQAPTALPGLAAAYTAPNRAHNLRAFFTPEGIRLTPRSYAEAAPPWQWALALRGYGDRETIQPAGPAALQSQANRLAYLRGPLTEAYLNTARGLAQHFTLPAPPLSNQPGASVLTFNFQGDLTPSLAADSSAVDLETSGGVRVLHYGELTATDSAGRLLPAHFELAADTLRLMVDTSTASYPIAVDLLLSSPTWTAAGDQAGARFGFSVGTAGDVDGDGFSDVLIGAPGYDKGQPGEGAAFLYSGSPTGLGAFPTWTAAGGQAGAAFGHAVGIAGDVDGDGFSDVVIGAPGYDESQPDEGAAFVYGGGPQGLSTLPAWSAVGRQAGAAFGTAVGTAGDVDGDGFSDVLIGAPGYDGLMQNEGAAYLFPGSPAGLAVDPTWTAAGGQSGAAFGTALGTAGDVNGDGFSDVLIGAPGYDHRAPDDGRACLYSGSPTGLSPVPTWTASGGQAGAAFGTALGTAGDVDGDGYSDVLIGAPGYDRIEPDEGRAALYPGGPAGLGPEPTWTAAGGRAGAALGAAVGTAGDMNGDGFSDVLVGAPGYTQSQAGEGRAYRFYGGPTGLGTAPAWTAAGGLAAAAFGAAVGTAGDVDGDGYSEALIGAPGETLSPGPAGRAQLYLGGPASLASTPAWVTEGGPTPSTNHGYTVRTAGDVNGDGFSDVLVSALQYNFGFGRVYVYHGGPAGLSATPDWIADGDSVLFSFGRSAGTAGDVNGDGFSDVIIGDPYYQPYGRVLVYLGGFTGLSPDPNWIAEGNHFSRRFGISVGTAGDVNGDGFSDVIIGAFSLANSGAAFVYHGGPAGLGDSPDWLAQETDFGFSVGTAGDVNGDGFSDVVVGNPYADNQESNEGRIFVYFGGPNGLGAARPWSAAGDQPQAQLGFSVGTAGDVNGDGYSDVLAGAPFYDNLEADEGRAYLYLGGPGGPAPFPAWTAAGGQQDARYGYEVGTAGDVDGDGYSDVIISAPYFDHQETDEGRVYLYNGGPGGLSLAPAWTAESDQRRAHFGFSVGAAGDVNGDGFSDVLVGAPDFNSYLPRLGRAFLFPGNGAQGLPLLPRQLHSDSLTPIAHLGTSHASTEYTLSLTGRMPLGRQDVRLHWQAAPLGTPLTATGVLSGTSSWTDVLTTGVALTQTVSGLAPGTPYHWRVRLLYKPGNPLGQAAGRWVHIPWGGWNETALRTAPAPPLTTAPLDPDPFDPAAPRPAPPGIRREKYPLYFPLLRAGRP